MAAFTLELLFALLTVVQLALGAVNVDTLKAAQRGNPRTGRYAQHHRWCWASAILLIISSALCILELAHLIPLRYRARRVVRFLRSQPWNAPAAPGEKDPETTWPAARRQGYDLPRLEGSFVLWTQCLAFAAQLLGVVFACMATHNLRDPERYARRRVGLLHLLAQTVPAMLAVGLLHCLVWVGRIGVAAREDRVVNASVPVAKDTPPAFVQECIYVPSREAYRGMLFTLPPVVLAEDEAKCALCGSALLPPAEPQGWANKHMFWGRVAVAEPLWGLRCKHVFHMRCLNPRFELGNLGCPACPSRLDAHTGNGWEQVMRQQ